MCGIFAMTGKLDADRMNRVLQSMSHRGPDEGDDTLLDSFHLGHQRLSVVGVDEGKQPIANENKKKWIVANGEIYNYRALQKQLPDTVHFLTKSDSEVPLKWYEEEGPQAVQRLDGMFAFVIVDAEEETFMAARDTLGIKPLYYGKDHQGNMIFASELKTLYVVTEDVHEFPPGHYYTPEEGFVAYRHIRQPERENIYPEHEVPQMMKGIRDHLGQAVEKRLMADVEVGVLLSGGLDSSLIALLAHERRKKGRPLKSFCVGSEDSEDVKRARQVAEEIGTEHYEYIYTEQELIDHLPEVIYHLESFDSSLVRSAIPTFFVSKLAAKHVKVILSGEGADELFSGYHYLKGIQDTPSLNKELVRIINTLHNINLQRADRMSMAHSLELRVPFLDLDLMEYALKIPAELKLTDNDVEKWILRKAYDGRLADNIIWRDKAEFSEGSGALDILENYAEDQFSQEQVEQANAENEWVRSKQELLYYTIFKKYFPEKSILSTVGHWATT
ncbi:asparagine synthase (glutamine-hydrolyzing) [Geomicrobium halophilum]|uniref:asparagine synthase (glutamine-hydrolyzing) n=1 Tax=Geomicrobium halophilum TaxID=549000 RepID=A0A841Q0E8_9BACL|nr:asparagine synthase B [Geomicrobium halophilum]MBB6451123.1 asparagine synthase (glutamine-hydrolyzing) [Geomicrobium halophilum]